MTMKDIRNCFIKFVNILLHSSMVGQSFKKHGEMLCFDLIKPFLRCIYNLGDINAFVSIHSLYCVMILEGL